MNASCTAAVVVVVLLQLLSALSHECWHGARDVIGCVTPGQQVPVARLERSTSRAVAVVGTREQWSFKCHR